MLSWNDVVQLIRRAHIDQDTNVAQKEVDLAYGAKDRQADITFFSFFIIPMYVLCVFPSKH
jgi:hypothetical protein